MAIDLRAWRGLCSKNRPETNANTLINIYDVYMYIYIYPYSFMYLDIHNMILNVYDCLQIHMHMYVYICI